jgi:maltodextrin utilization protein YvdJ
MFLPLSLSVIYMDNIDYERFGFNFQENIPDWLPSELPEDCRIESNALLCTSNEVYTNTITNNDTEYTVYINVSDNVSEAFLTEDVGNHAIVFQETMIRIHLDNGQAFVVSYSGFDDVDFSQVKTLDQETAAYIFFDGVFKSLQPYMILPLILYSVGGMILLNALFIIIIASAAMIFKLSVSNFISYKNMIKLFILAQTIPAVINLFVGFFGLSPFTSIIYNFLTPLMALVFYRKNMKEIGQ